ncbi:MAG: flagellar biosynthesis anti-sigma factor FlgM [Deltaproteobacteria bacterium]|nr:flagellar biosynthesis anti-sigma factor FlgM [Deltaproteobacteria bacterium]
MKIDALTRLFSVNSESYKAQTTTNAIDQDVRAKNSEAVKVKSDFGKAQVEQSDADRQAKVASLKKQVADGTYSRSSREVAEALARELFA